jgi:hypothetical protein
MLSLSTDLTPIFDVVEQWWPLILSLMAITVGIPWVFGFGDYVKDSLLQMFKRRGR